MLFADLRGFTAYSERAAPDRVVELLNRYFSAAVPVIINHGGTVTSFIGDALMALFNAPIAQPEHAVRAARAGLEMQRVIEAVAGDDGPGEPGEPGEVDPRFRVGINTGPALVGNIGSVQRRSYTAIGDAVNVAARLEGQADPGEVVIGGATCRALGDLAQVRALGRLHVKGRTEAVEAYRLVGLGRPRGPRETMIGTPVGAPTRPHSALPDPPGRP